MLIAVAKTVAAVITGSASMVAESAHSWADAGNEVLLVIAQRQSAKQPDDAHPFGFGREAYVWSLFAAVGLFVAGAAVSITHGVQELIHPQPADDFIVGYIVLGIAFVLEGVSFGQALRQARPEAASMDRDLVEHVMKTSDPTLRGRDRRGRGGAHRAHDRRNRARAAPGHRIAGARRDRLDPGRCRCWPSSPSC